MESTNSPIHRFTNPEADIDSVIEPILVLHGERVEMEQNMIPDMFWPVTGKWQMRGTTIQQLLRLYLANLIRSTQSLR